MGILKSFKKAVRESIFSWCKFSSVSFFECKLQFTIPNANSLFQAVALHFKFEFKFIWFLETFILNKAVCQKEKRLTILGGIAKDESYSKHKPSTLKIKNTWYFESGDNCHF